MDNQEPVIDTTVPHSARVWNYWLGGKDNYPVDREAGDQFLSVFPGIARMARASRAFQTRAVRHLAGEKGIKQFLDVGTGLPTANNTHEVAQSVVPEARIVRGQRPSSHPRAGPVDQCPEAHAVHPRRPVRTREDPGTGG